MLTVEDFSERIFRKMLAVRAPAPLLSKARVSSKPPRQDRSPPLFPLSDEPKGELADDPEENRAVACSRLTDLLRKASSDASLVKVPLRCLRDAILLNATRAGENAREVEALFSLFEGVVALCHALQSRGAPGPYESVERAVRLEYAAVWNNPTSMCAYATVSTQALRPCFENSTRAIDSSKNQPNRLRFDRAREF